MMSADDVLSLLDLFKKSDIEIWIDGGWGVDALLGEQTRPHDDLDVVLKYSDIGRFMRLMGDQSFCEIRRDGPFNFVLADNNGRHVDVHIIDFETTRIDGCGRAVYGVNGLPCEVGSLDGIGMIQGRRVTCCTAECQVRSHTGYEIDKDDFRDVMGLHRRFDIPLPPAYILYQRNSRHQKLLKGLVVAGSGDFTRCMNSHSEVFRNATGETLFAGTLNVKMDGPIPIQEQFRIRGTDIGEADQDLLFEVCRINGMWAYRIRPYNLWTGTGGYGDHILEMVSTQRIPNAAPGSEVEIVLFRDDIQL